MKGLMKSSLKSAPAIIASRQDRQDRMEFNRAELTAMLQAAEILDDDESVVSMETYSPDKLIVGIG